MKLFFEHKTQGGSKMKTNFVGSSFRTIVVIMLVILFSFAGAQSAEWKPSKPIQFVVPYAPGGGSDVLARSIENIIKTEKLCPVPIIVVNQAGGSGTIGMTSVAQSPGNVHMMMTFISGQVTSPLVAGKGVATFHDLTLICNLALDEQLIVVKTDSPFKTIEDVVAAAKQRSGALTIGGTATGQEDQMCNRLFEKAAGIKLRYVPFNSGGECLTAVMGGHVDMIWANPSEFVPQWEAKMVRPIVVAKETRIPLLPDVPTFKEKGYDVTFKFFRGIAAPPGIPAETVAFYESMMKRMSESSGWKEKYLKQYMLSSGWMGSKEFTQFVNQSEHLFKDILKDLGLLK
jgi:putative tricarboxylic transport membrane protein